MVCYTPFYNGYVLLDQLEILAQIYGFLIPFFQKLTKFN